MLFRYVVMMLIFCAVSQAQMLLPAAAEYQPKEGQFQLSASMAVMVPSSCEKRLTQVLHDMGVKELQQRSAAPVISCLREKVKNPPGFPGAYHLSVSVDHILLRAFDDQGFLHGIESLRQLTENGVIACCDIHDWPAFPLRGFMLDTGRNYQSPALIKEQIEIMARYKYNVFHFHFTDNPGWRLESKIHPQVTAATSMTRQPGKFYTQQEFKDLVAFAKERGIMLIPEMDMPGHSASLRKALGISSMNAAESRTILKELLTELASLASPTDMPYIHIGTDEVRGAAETVDATFVPEMSAHVRGLGRKVIGWHQGLNDAQDTEKIAQLWARTAPLARNPFLDSRSTYINHMDPHEAAFTFLHRASCQVPVGNARALGGILCSWPDILIGQERDQIVHNAVYPAMLAYAESVWSGVKRDCGERYAANLPPVGTPEFERCEEFEKRLMRQRQRDFTDENFPVYPQTQMRWRIIGPFPHGNDLTKKFPVEQQLSASYDYEGQNYQWLPQTFAAATLYYQHFFGFGGLVQGNAGTCYALTHIWSPDARTVGAFINFHNSSRSDRRGNEQAVAGQWHDSQPWVKINGVAIAPPQWQSLARKNDETPFTDEDYQMRPPTAVSLKQGWNEILLKVPKHSKGWKWCSTFLPIKNTQGLRYSAKLRPR